jgi:hypothetical protein
MYYFIACTEELKKSNSFPLTVKGNVDTIYIYITCFNIKNTEFYL